MYTLKFYGKTSEGPIERFVTCAAFDVAVRGEGKYIITPYAGMTKASQGVDHHIQEGGGFYTCYVENSNGRTVAKYSSVSGTLVRSDSGLA